MVDNGSSHRGQASVDRLEGAWPNLRLIHLPVHASWLNQIEIVFSIIQRKVVTPNDFFDLDQITDRLAAFEDRYNQTWPNRSTGDSPETTSTACSSASPSTTLPPCRCRRRLSPSAENPSIHAAGRPDTGHKRNPVPPPGCRPSSRSARTSPRNRHGWPDRWRTPTGSPSPHNEAGTAALPPRRSAPSTYAKPDRNRTFTADKPGHRSRAWAESRWLSEDFVDSGIFTSPTLRPRPPARRHSVHPQTLRIYEREGLVEPGRSAGGTRLYSGDDVTRLREIAALIDGGLNIAGIKRVLQLQGEVRRLQAEVERLSAEAEEPTPQSAK